MGEQGSPVLPEDAISFQSWCILSAGKSQNAQTPKAPLFFFFNSIFIAVVFLSLKDEWPIRMTMLCGNDWMRRFNNRLSLMLF